MALIKCLSTHKLPEPRPWLNTITALASKRAERAAITAHASSGGGAPRTIARYAASAIQSSCSIDGQYTKPITAPESPSIARSTRNSPLSWILGNTACGIVCASP